MKNYFLQLILLSSFTTSCASFFGDEIVVERSKTQAPNWIDLDLGKFIKQDNDLLFHSLSSPHADLPLGLKRAQTQSLEKGEVGLKTLIENRQEKFLSIDRIHEVQKIKLYQDLQDTIIKEAFRKGVKIADIYFEKLRNESAKGDELSEYYRVHTLMSTTDANISIMLRDLATRCQKSGNPTLKKFGVDLISRLES